MASFRLDSKKSVSVAVVLGALFLGWFLYRVSFGLFELLKVSAYPFGDYVSVPHVLGVVVAGLSFWYLRRLASVAEFLSEVVSEVNKVTWPSRKETVGSTVVVVVITVICSAILGVFDFVWVKAVQFVLSV